MRERQIRLLFDENLSARLVAALADVYPGSVHVEEVGMAGTPDLAIWAYAREHDLTIVSKDEDFVRLSILLGSPPKVIWVRLGNCSTNDVIRLLVQRRSLIEDFAGSDEAALIELA